MSLAAIEIEEFILVKVRYSVLCLWRHFFNEIINIRRFAIQLVSGFHLRIYKNGFPLDRSPRIHARQSATATAHKPNLDKWSGSSGSVHRPRLFVHMTRPTRFFIDWSEAQLIASLCCCRQIKYTHVEVDAHKQTETELKLNTKE